VLAVAVAVSLAVMVAQVEVWLTQIISLSHPAVHTL